MLCIKDGTLVRVFQKQDIRETYQLNF